VLKLYAMNHELLNKKGALERGVLYPALAASLPILADQVIVIVLGTETSCHCADCKSGVYIKILNMIILWQEGKRTSRY
jgi:hypothetical protein